MDQGGGDVYISTIVPLSIIMIIHVILLLTGVLRVGPRRSFSAIIIGTLWIHTFGTFYSAVLAPFTTAFITVVFIVTGDGFLVLDNPLVLFSLVHVAYLIFLMTYSIALRNKVEGGEGVAEE